MIALAIFGVFIVAFMAGQGYNVTDSTSMSQDIKLKEFAQLKMNELVVSPPEFKEGLTLTPEKGKFEENDQYTFEITYKRFKLPDLSKIRGIEEDAQQDSAEAQLQKKIFETVQKNIKEIIWQVEVKVTDTNTDNFHVVSTWLDNEKAEVKLDGF